jgi:TolA-binding protein
MTRSVMVTMAAIGLLGGMTAAVTFAQETTPAAPPSSTSSTAAPPVISPPEGQPTAPPSSTSPADAPPVVTPTEQPAAPLSSPSPTEAPPAAISAEQPTAPSPASEAAAAAPEPTGAALSRALSAYEKQDFATAADAFKSAIDEDPTSVQAHYYLGYALYKLKRFDESRVAFTQAYQLQSNYLPPIAAPK